jgi:hypothetical protein
MQDKVNYCLEREMLCTQVWQLLRTLHVGGLTVSLGQRVPSVTVSYRATVSGSCRDGWMVGRATY